MAQIQDGLKRLPGVDKILNLPEIKKLKLTYNEQLVKHAVRSTIDSLRQQALNAKPVPSITDILEQIKSELSSLTEKSLRNVINATGVIIHTNLGRAPFSDELVKETSAILTGYNNLEFDLSKGERGSRNKHLYSVLKYLTGAEDVLVVNNNAAALMLILRTFAKNKGVIVSRGELIEIGGSFRLPDIMAASDCRMIEVGTTNKTGITDYEKAIDDSTALLLKAHKSNYVIMGFTLEASLAELVALGRQKNLPVVYDMGSGLLRKTGIEMLKDEPDVRETLSLGVDLVCFSGDKLLGGDQAGIIAGKKELIARLKKEPMVRALRVGKTTLAYMQAALSYYMDDKILLEKNTLFRMLNQKPKELKLKAQKLKESLTAISIKSTVVKSKAQCGGGALPGKEFDSFAVRIESDEQTGKKRSEFSEKLYYGLMRNKTPIVAILRKGDVYFDLTTVPEEQIPVLVLMIDEIYKKIIPA